MRRRGVLTSVSAHVTAGGEDDSTADAILKAHYASAPHVQRQLQQGAGGAAAAPPPKSGLDCLNYAYSFITNPGPLNAVRFWIESRTTIYDDAAETSTVVYQCKCTRKSNTHHNLFQEDASERLCVIAGASCKSENTFVSHEWQTASQLHLLPSLPLTLVHAR